MRLRSLAPAAAALAATAWTEAALACPSCLAGNNATYLKIGAILSLVPFAVVAVVLWVLRQAPEIEGRAARPAEAKSRQ